MGVGRGGAFDDVARHLARTLNRAAQVPEPAGTEVAALLRAWTEIGPSDAVELEHQLVAHLRLDLASAWHGIRRRAERASLMSVVGRYREAVSRLSRAVPRPRARGPIGVDVDGELVEVVSDGAGVRWGQAAQVVWVDGEGLRAAEARRLLRAMSSGGAVRSALGTADDGVEQLGRWLGCEFQLRTLA
jgi:hypothetical protein